MSLDLFERLDQSEHVIAGLDIPVVQSERHEQVRPTLAAGSAQTGERAIHAAVILRDRHLVVVHDDDEVAALFGGVVQPLERDGGTERAIADHGDHIAYAAAAVHAARQVTALRQAARQEIDVPV